MCLSQVLLGLELSARAWSRSHRLRADVWESSPVGGCKYERYVWYVSTDEQCRVKFCGIKLIFDLLFQTFLSCRLGVCTFHGVGGGGRGGVRGRMEEKGWCRKRGVE